MKPAPILALIFALILPTSAAIGQTSTDTQPTVKSLVVGEGDRVFDSANAHGRYLAIHFLFGARSDANTMLLREYAEKAPTLAGITHIFVQPTTPEEFASTLADAPAVLKPSFFRDADGKLADALAIPNNCLVKGQPLHFPAMILLDANGKEVFRTINKSDTDRVSFGVLAAKVAELTKNKETAESNLAGGPALQGYDPVAYLDQQKAIAGDQAIQSTFRGVPYRFATAVSRDTFNADPMKYLPAYGGWCATAMAKGSKVEVDPKNFKVTGGRVFLFYKGLFGNALNDWNKDEPGLTTKADTSWHKVVMSK